MGRRSAPLGTSVLDLDVDDSKLHSKLSGARLAAEKWTDQTGASLAKAGKAISGVGTAWTRNITLPILAAGGAAAKMGLDFDTTFRQIVGLTDVTADEVDGLKEKILAMAPAVGKGPQELAEAFYFVASAGFTAAEAMEVLETAAKASATGLGDTQTVAKVLGSVINAYGHENITAAQAADQLTAAVKDGTAEASDYAGVIGRVVPAAAAMGVSFDQVTAALAAMTLTGLSAEEAATGLNQVLVSLLKPTTQAEDALASMGLSAEGLRQELREKGLLATLRTLEERFQGNDAAAAAVFGNVRALRTVTALLSLDTEQLNKVFADTADSVGLAGDAFGTVAEGPGFKMQQSMARIQAAAITIGDDVLPMLVVVIDEVAKHISDLADWWDSLDQGTRDVIVQTLAMIAVAGPLLIVVGKLIGGLGALVKVVGWLTGTKGLSALVARIPLIGAAASAVLGPLALLALALGGLIVIADQVDGALNPVEAAFDDLAKGAGKSAKEVWNQTKALADKFKKPVGEIERLIIEAAEQYGLSWDEAFEHVEASLRLHGGEVVDQFETTGYHARQALAEHTDGIVDDMEGLPPEIAALLADGADEVGAGAETGITDPVAEAAAKAREVAVDQMKVMLSRIKALFDNDTSIQEAFDALLERMDDPYTTAERKADIFTTDLIKIIRGALKSGDPLIVADTADLVSDMLFQFDTLEPGALAAGTAVPPALRDGMDAGVGALIRWVEDNVAHEALTSLTLTEAQDLGYEGLYLYAKGMQLADYQQGVGVRTAIQAAVKRDLNVDLFAEGWNTGVSYGEGLDSAWNNYIRSKAQQIRDGVQGFLQFSGSPAYTHSREYGEGVAASWWQAFTAELAHGIPQIHDALERVFPSGALLSDVGMPSSAALAGMLGPATSAGSTIPGRGAVEIHEHYELTVEGMRKIVDTPEEALDVLRALGTFGGRRG